MVDTDGALRLMRMTLQAYADRQARHGVASAEADGLCLQFAGAKFMLHALCGGDVKDALLQQLREEGFAIPRCGDREPDGGFFGFDSDADACSMARV